MDPVNWRTKFPAESREKVVNKIISSLMKRFPFSEHEKHMSDYKRIAVNFEEKVYMVARDQQDYIMRIKSRLESKNLNPGGKQGQSISVQATTLSQAHEQHSLPHVQDNTASGGAITNLASARPTVSISPHVALPNNASENSNLQSVFGNSQRSVGNLSGCGQPFNISVNNLRQEQGRQNSPQIVSQQNHEQLNPHLYKQVKQENISPSYITQKQLQPQHHYQPKLLNPTQQHTSQQSMLQTPVMCPSETRVAQLSDIWQDQMSYFDQTTQSGNKTQSQIAFRQTNQSQVALDIHQNVSSSSQNPLMQSQKQVHLIGRKLTATNTQQNHLDGQPNGCPNLHQQQPRLPCQQNTVQQQFQVQKINHSSAHHEQLSERNNMYVLPQSSQLLETECASSGMRLCEVKMHGQTQHKASVLLPNQDQESQADSLERRLNSQIQPQKMEQLPDPSAQDQQQTYQTSGTLTSSSARRVSCTENWQEDAYQMLQSLKSKYLTPLTDMYNTITCRLQQLNSISQQTETGSIEKLNSLRNRVNTIISNLSFPKSNIPPSYKESLGLFEKYIISILSVRGRGNSAPSQQHGQQSSDVHSMRQFVQLRSQTSPVQTQQDEKKPTFQPVNSRDSATMQRSNATNLENDSKSVSEHPTLQPTEKYSGKMGSFNIVQQVSSGTLNIPRSNLQQSNIKALLSHSPVHGPQSNVNAFEPSCNTLQEMCLKQPKEERDVQTQIPKQELQDRHEMLHQSVQQKQIMQQHSGMVRLQSGASFPTDLPKTYGSSCSQVPRCPTIDKKNLPMPLTEARTTFYPINSRSTKTSCLVPLPSSSVPGDFERPISDTSSLSNAGDEQVNIAAKSPSPIAISTPGISVSPLLEESSNVIHCDTSTTMSDELSASEQPIQRLIKVVNLMSSKTLSASVLDIGSVVCTTDRISGSATLTGSGGSIGEDLAGMTNSRLQKSYLTWQGMTFGTKNMKRCRSTVPIDVVATATGSICDSSKLSDTEIFDLESTAISYIKRPRIEVNQTLLEEITAINYQLIDTVLDISDEDTPPTVVSAQFRGGQGTIVRCSFIAVSISPNLKSQQFPIQPLRLLVPANYPLCSPIFLDKLRVEVSDELEDLSEKVKSKLNMSLRRLTEPLSLGEIARTWDVCARAVISEYAQQNGGGNLSSKYGEWEDCLNAS